MRVAFARGDGYCGWATALYLSKKGHSAALFDNFVRRQWDHELGVQTLTPIRTLSDRLKIWRELTGKHIDLFVGDVTDYDSLSSTIKAFGPDAVVRFAEQHIPDPRVDAEEHYYNAKPSKLMELALKPHLLSDSLLNSLVNIALRYRIASTPPP